MSLKCIRSKISTVFLFFPAFCFSQGIPFDTLQFYKHLVNDGLLTDQITFTKQIQKQYLQNTLVHDSLSLAISAAYYKLGNIDSSRTNLLKISEQTIFSSSASCTYLTLLLLQNEHERIATYIKLHDRSMIHVYHRQAAMCINILENKPTYADTNISGYAQAIIDIKHKYEHPPDRSVFMSGVYSALIPGMGKLYLGYKEQAISAFIENIALGGQAAESYYRAGPKSARFIITGSLFGLFYGGNIWGSILLAKKQKRDHRKQIEYEIFNYYNTRITSSTY